VPDLLLRSADVALLLLLAGLMARSRRRDHTPWVGVALALSVASFVVTSARGVGLLLGPALWPLTAICVAKAVLLWLFARGLFSDAFRLHRGHAAILAAMIAAGLWHELLLDRRHPSPAEVAGSLAFEVATLAFVVAGPLWVLRGRVGDLEERRRRFRLAFVLGVAAYLAAVVAVQSTNLLQGASTPPALVTANLAFILAGTLAAILTLVDLRPVSWLDAPASSASPEELAPAEQRVLDRLRHAFETDRAWREEGLTVAALATRLATQERLLRRAIHQGLGFRNFNDFLHSWRLREACARLRAEPGSPVTSIALDVGYGSIGPFNRAFKQRLGMTPTEFRRSAPGLADSGIGQLAPANRQAVPRATS
jgi:AraC-like DNA-binding protein